MLKQRYHILTIFISLLAAHFASAADRIDLIADEDWIPLHAELTAELDTDIGTLYPGERVVVLRPLTKDTVRVDVPRKGVTTLAVEATNLSVEIENLKSVKDIRVRIVPRMSLFLANRVASGVSMWQDIVPAEKVYSTKRWLLLYGDATQAPTREAVVAANKYYASLSDEVKETLLFVYMDVPGNKSAIQDLAEYSNPKIDCMPGYLSKGYSQSLDHLVAEKDLPQLVELASSGRVINEAVGVAEIIDFLKLK